MKIVKFILEYVMAWQRKLCCKSRIMFHVDSHRLFMVDRINCLLKKTESRVDNYNFASISRAHTYADKKWAHIESIQPIQFAFLSLQMINFQSCVDVCDTKMFSHTLHVWRFGLLDSPSSQQRRWFNTKVQ